VPPRPVRGEASGDSPSLRVRAFRPGARASVRLLGPCFETGRTRPSADAPETRGDRSSRPARDPRPATGPGGPAGRPSRSPRLSARPFFLAPASGRRRTPGPRPWAGRRVPPLLPAAGAASARRAAERRRAGRLRGRGAERLPRTPFARARAPEPRRGLRRSSSLPPQRFRALFNFLSEFFSPFRRRTCSLSVSPERLALDGIYHPIWAAVPSDPTPGRVPARRDPRGAAYGAVALRGAALPGGFDPPRAPAGTRPETTIRRSRGTGDFGIGLRPLRSPLLRTSPLVSFPPASDMLKFAG
jgi:hypothetical protein